MTTYQSFDTFRHQIPLEQLLDFAPQLASYMMPKPAAATATGPVTAARSQSDTHYAFWTTFSFGCIQAVVLFCLIYSYFAQ